ncbi:MAG TPA: phosphatase PAP2 family protein [Gammaproteobacteria bacterium]
MGQGFGPPAGERSQRGARGVALAALCAVCCCGAPAAADSESAGDVLRIALPAAAFALTVKRDDREGRRQFYKSFGANVGATLLLKAAVDKDRPDGSDDDAFPSGHASMAFQGAAFMHRRYGWRPAVPAYVLAAYTAWSRVDADEHDEADVLAGAALGIASSFLLAERRDTSVAARVGPDGFEIRITGRLR